MAFVEGPLPQRLKIIHGFGAVAFGVKDSGFSFFLLLYYSQVLGMDAATVSLALLLALLFDAVIDPLLGNLSDRTYSRWGRRLPWLYAAPIPLAFAWVFLWSPPTSGVPSFGELLTIAIIVRVLLSACEVPSVSLVPEVTSDYDERTTLFRYRFLSGWVGGLLMMILAYLVFMPGPDGLLQPEGYVTFGIFGAVLMVVSVIGSAAGQHSIIARLPDHKPPPFTFGAAFHEIRQAFSERSFLFFAAGGLAAYVGQGMFFSISNYLNLFVWQLDRTELVLYPVTLFLSVVLMFVLVGPMHRRFGKPVSAVIGSIAGISIMSVPYLLLLSGHWPQTGTLASTFGFFAFLLLANTMGVVTMISATSMIAEIVEAFEERTHRRAEGAFYAGNWLVQKCATGLGIFLTGQIISWSQLSPGIEPSAVAAAVVREMVIYYLGFGIGLALISAYWLGRFPISREEHEARVATLAKRRKDALNAAARGDIDAGTIVP